MVLKISDSFSFFYLEKALKQPTKGYFKKYSHPVQNKSNINLSGRSVIQPGQSGPVFTL